MIEQSSTTAKSLQLCPTLCDPTDGSPPGAPVPGILQARTLEWAAISFSNAWQWSRSVVSDSSRPHGLQPIRLLHPWDFPGKSTGAGCHCLLHNNPLGWIFTPQTYRWGNRFPGVRSILTSPFHLAAALPSLPTLDQNYSRACSRNKELVRECKLTHCFLHWGSSYYQKIYIYLLEFNNVHSKHSWFTSWHKLLTCFCYHGDIWYNHMEKMCSLYVV